MGSEYPLLQIPSKAQSENQAVAEPILNDGKIADLELTKLAIERVLERFYKEVNKSDTDFNVSNIPAIILSFAFVNSKLTTPQQQLLEWLVNDCNIPKCQIVESSRMVLFGTGRISGLVMDMGLESTRMSPIVDGERLFETMVNRFPIGGLKLSETLKYLIEKHKDFIYFPIEDADEIKHNSCFVSLDFEQDITLYNNSTAFAHSFKLPDGLQLTIERERFLPAEMYFSPKNYSLCGKCVDYEFTLQEAIGKAFLDSPMDIRKVLFQSMVLGGGPSMMPGFAPRLSKEVKNWYHVNILGNRKQVDQFEHNIYMDSRSNLSAFRGVSLQGAINIDNAQLWYTKEILEEGFRAINF